MYSQYHNSSKKSRSQIKQAELIFTELDDNQSYKKETIKESSQKKNRQKPVVVDVFQRAERAKESSMMKKPPTGGRALHITDLKTAREQREHKEMKDSTESEDFDVRISV